MQTIPSSCATSWRDLPAPVRLDREADIRLAHGDVAAAERLAARAAELRHAAAGVEVQR